MVRKSALLSSLGYWAGSQAERFNRQNLKLVLDISERVLRVVSIKKFRSVQSTCSPRRGSFPKLPAQFGRTGRRVHERTSQWSWLRGTVLVRLGLTFMLLVVTAQCFHLWPRTHGHRHTLCMLDDVRIDATWLCMYCTGSNCFPLSPGQKKMLRSSAATRPDDKRNVGARLFFEGHRTFKTWNMYNGRETSQSMTHPFAPFFPFFHFFFFLFFFFLFFLLWQCTTGAQKSFITVFFVFFFFRFSFCPFFPLFSFFFFPFFHVFFFPFFPFPIFQCLLFFMCSWFHVLSFCHFLALFLFIFSFPSFLPSLLPPNKFMMKTRKQKRSFSIRWPV